MGGVLYQVIDKYPEAKIEARRSYYEKLSV